MHVAYRIKKCNTYLVKYVELFKEKKHDIAQNNINVYKLVDYF